MPLRIFPLYKAFNLFFFFLSSFSRLSLISMVKETHIWQMEEFRWKESNEQIRCFHILYSLFCILDFRFCILCHHSFFSFYWIQAEKITLFSLDKLIRLINQEDQNWYNFQPLLSCYRWILKLSYTMWYMLRYLVLCILFQVISNFQVLSFLDKHQIGLLCSLEIYFETEKSQ